VSAETPTFEEAMEDLERCVERLESDDLTLEEALAVFERGVAASRACAGLLDQSRQRVRVLVEKAGGDFDLAFLDPGDEEALQADADEEPEDDED
jgi:exodeoxyribonuclease VII small subunit